MVGAKKELKENPHRWANAYCCYFCFGVGIAIGIGIETPTESDTEKR